MDDAKSVAQKGFWASLKDSLLNRTTFWFDLLIVFLFIALTWGYFWPYLEVQFEGIVGTVITVLNIARPTLVILDIALAVAFLLLLMRVWEMRPPISVFRRAQAKKKQFIKDPVIIKQWEHIAAKAAMGTFDNVRLAVIEADALVDSVLKKNGYAGEHMADRLSQILPEEVKSLENVWRAHRLRNDVVHTPGFAPRPDDVRAALQAFEDFLKEINAL